MTEGSFDHGAGVGDVGVHNFASQGSPLFDFLTAFVPRKLKDLFRLCEYLYFNSGQIYAVLQKFCTYPVTDVIYETQNESLRNFYEDLHDKTFKIKRVLIKAAIDKFIYGNSFTSLYTPFVRFLRCHACNNLTNITQVSYKFKLKKLAFTYTCAGCKALVTATDKDVIDKKITRKDHIKIIRWDPKLMDMDYNPITGHSEYFYTIPKELKERAAKGNKHLIDTMPMEFLRALRDDKIFKFAEGEIFHMRMDAPAGIDNSWGFPPLASTIKLFLYAAVLRKANECVSLTTPIETINGLVPADEVGVGDRVRTHTGKWQEVVDKVYRDARPDEIGRVFTLSALREFSSTFSPKHPILTLRRNQISRRSDTKDSQRSSVMVKRPHLYEEVLCPAGQMKPNEYVLYPRYLPAIPQTIDVAARADLRRIGDYAYSDHASSETLHAFAKLEDDEWVPHDSAGRVAKRYVREGRTPKRVLATRMLTPDLAYILGWYTGDGSCNKRTVAFSLGLDDAPELLKKAIANEFGLEAGDNVSSEGNVRSATASHVIVRNLIKGMVPGIASNKRVPDEIMNGPNDVKLAFLKGYHEADGHEARTRNTFATSSRALAYDVFRLLLHVGCIATIESHITKDSTLKDGRIIKGGNLHYRVDTNGPSRARLTALWEGRPTKEITIGKTGFFWKEYFAVRIHAIEHVKETRYIDFKVAVDETFCVAGGASHNSIALDYVVPLRIISPKMGSGNGDPVTTISLAKWTSEMKHSVKKWRRDPLHIMWSPVPAEVTHFGGQARALMTLGEIQAAEDNIIAAMGLPKEFIVGGFSAMGSGIQLRVLENQLTHQTSDLNDLLQWITDKCAKQLGRSSVTVSLAPFRFIDDVQQKALLLQLNVADPQGGPWISKRTMGEAFDVDPQEERKWRTQEALDDARAAQELQDEMQKRQRNLANQARAQAAMGQQGGLGYDQQAVMAQADQIAQQLMSMDPGSRQSQMHALEGEDGVMFAVVKSRMETMTTQQNHEAITAARQGGDPSSGADPAGGGDPMGGGM
jgi:intein/homing endonuclease